MAVRRHYIETGDVSGSTEAQVALAEELIDRYVGPQPQFMRATYHGSITAITNSNKTFADTGTNTQLDLTNNQFKGAVLEMLSGSAAANRAVVDSSDKTNKTVTLKAALSTTPAVGDYFKIYQLAKFPRIQDVYATPDGLYYYPNIPEAVREATVAQVEFIIAKGAGYFTGGDAELQSESFLNYSYKRLGSDSNSGSGGSSLSNLIAPQAKALLRGIMNRKGNLHLGGYRHVGKYPI